MGPAMKKDGVYPSREFEYFPITLCCLALRGGNCGNFLNNLLSAFVAHVDFTILIQMRIIHGNISLGSNRVLFSGIGFALTSFPR